jgi:hypothetical protein
MGNTGFPSLFNENLRRAQTEPRQATPKSRENTVVEMGGKTISRDGMTPTKSQITTKGSSRVSVQRPLLFRRRLESREFIEVVLNNCSRYLGFKVTTLIAFISFIMCNK